MKKITLVVLDRFGIAPPSGGNPVTKLNMPFFNGLISKYITKSITASGLVVGLNWGMYGNSEVGHSAIGTGRVVVQSLARINNEIENKQFFDNLAFLKVLNHAKDNKSKIHVVGCLSPGGIHSHEDHLIALLEFFHKYNFKSVYVHIITDGEDSDKEQGLKSLEKLKMTLLSTGAKVASISGRNFAMDRVGNWSLVEKAWRAMAGKSERWEGEPEDYIKKSYRENIFDSDILPIAITDDMGNSIKIGDQDGLVFFNFRNDRMKELVSTFVLEEFTGFDRGNSFQNLSVATMTDYSPEFKVLVAYPPTVIDNTLGEIFSNKNIKQLRVAESEKEAHVTNFFNGGRLVPYIGENRSIIKSRILNGGDYVAHPEMSAGEITQAIIESKSKEYTFTIVNFANTDMVAHAGNISAAEKALQVVDNCLKKIIEASDLENEVVIITADHGNIEEMIDPNSHNEDTQHSAANVPILFVANDFIDESAKSLDNLFDESTEGSLIDVAPSILKILEIEQPQEMTGSSLV